MQPLWVVCAWVNDEPSAREVYADTSEDARIEAGTLLLNEHMNWKKPVIRIVTVYGPYKRGDVLDEQQEWGWYFDDPVGKTYGPYSCDMAAHEAKIALLIEAVPNVIVSVGSVFTCTRREPKDKDEPYVR